LKKNLNTIFAIIVLFFIFRFYSHGRLLGADIYPSDEELYEAYLAGDLEYQDYLNLKDLFDGGIDSTEMYLLEEIPNINYFLKSYTKDYSESEQEQTQPFTDVSEIEYKEKISGSFKWRRYQKLEENGDNENRFYLTSGFAPGWTFKARGTDEYDGRQTLSARSLIYKADQGTIKKLIVGNYTARFGLGLTVGYRGRLLDKDDLSESELIAFPDYSGFNGVYIEGGERKQDVKGMVHYDQNDTIRVQTVAVDLMREIGDFRIEGMVLGSLFKNRPLDADYKFYQFGTLFGYERDRFNGALELAFQKDASAFPAAVFESRYRDEILDIKFSAWHYDDDYKNFFGGGRSGSIYRSIELDTIGLAFRDRRNNQRGFLMRTRTAFSESEEFNLSFSLYGSGSHDRCTEMLASFEKILNPESRLRLFYEYERSEEMNGIATGNKWRAEYRRASKKFYFRSYIGYRYNSDDKEYLSQFVRVRFSHAVFDNIEFWFNLSRLNMETGKIDYFYGYLKESVELMRDFMLGVKYHYRYSRDYSDKEDIGIMLETELRW